jgi:enoyl-CoA hydratase/carnithine racemase
LASASAARKAAGFEGSPHEGWGYRNYYRAHHALYDEMEAVEKPIVIAAQGIALGAGVEMALSCDFRFCTPTAEWGLPEVGMGAIPGSGGTSRLTRIVGPAWAKYMTMSGSRISAERAQAIGLVHDIFPAVTFMDDVYAFCKRMVAHPAESVGMAKLAVDLSADVADRGVQRHVDRLVNSSLTKSEGYRAALARFSNKPK